jgi:Reverse transcriptase (RNA-dependent DNA polymerase)
MALEELGLHPVPGVNCLYANDWLILFFYVDDVVSMCHKQQTDRLRAFEQALFARFEMRSLGDPQWFLGIRITRDRNARKLWLYQDSYIAKIANKFNLTGCTRAPRTPLPTEGVPPAPDTQTTDAQLIYSYQQRVGSISFSAVITRADTAYAASSLVQHLKNLGKEHV